RTSPESIRNQQMSTIRISVEWEFGRTPNLFGFVDCVMNQKIFLSPVGMYYPIAVLFKNIIVCLGGGQSAKYFCIQPSTLEAYISEANQAFRQRCNKFPLPFGLSVCSTILHIQQARVHWSAVYSIAWCILHISIYFFTRNSRSTPMILLYICVLHISIFPSTRIHTDNTLYSIMLVSFAHRYLTLGSIRDALSH
ncbi:hypothetical protein BJV82DRAFT_526189, partial [Fennellomyces sp. T-0311]